MISFNENYQYSYKISGFGKNKYDYNQKLLVWKDFENGCDYLPFEMLPKVRKELNNNVLKEVM